MNKINLFRQKLIYSELNYGMSLPPAYFHYIPWLCGNIMN